MSRERRQNETADTANQGASGDGAPLSLIRLRAAFAQMLGEASRDEPSMVAEATMPCADATRPTHAVDAGETAGAVLDPCEINPRSVVEAMLFVGRSDDRPFSARELAAAMRGVSPQEVDAAIGELNAIYQRDTAPYRVVGSAHGYRLTLCDEFFRMRDKLGGRLKESQLSPAAIEVLSIVAYNQPTTAAEVSALRGAASGPALAALVRRKLLRIDPPAASGEPPRYSTTEQFLRLFRLASVAELPQSEELEKM